MCSIVRLINVCTLLVFFVCIHKSCNLCYVHFLLLHFSGVIVIDFN